MAGMTSNAPNFNLKGSCIWQQPKWVQQADAAYQIMPLVSSQDGPCRPISTCKASKKTFSPGHQHHVKHFKGKLDSCRQRKHCSIDGKPFSKSQNLRSKQHETLQSSLIESRRLATTQPPTRHMGDLMQESSEHCHYTDALPFFLDATRNYSDPSGDPRCSPVTANNPELGIPRKGTPAKKALVLPGTLPRMY